MAMADLTKLETRLFKWLCLEENDFEENAWSTKKAAKAFKVDPDEIYEALAALTEKIPHNIYIHYRDGAMRIIASE
jgi:hypothetical protein